MLSGCIKANQTEAAQEKYTNRSNNTKYGYEASTL